MGSISPSSIHLLTYEQQIGKLFYVYSSQSVDDDGFLKFLLFFFIIIILHVVKSYFYVQQWKENIYIPSNVDMEQINL